MKQIISVLVENQAGALNKITGLFARRAFNIESLAVGVTEDKSISRITMIVDSVNNANGERSFSASPTKLMQAVSKTTAGRVRDVLLGVVQNGTGTAAAIPGIDVAGKTGTAEKENGNDSWFVGMAPAEDPRVVVAIVIEDGEEGVGTAKAQNVLKTALEVQGLL